MGTALVAALLLASVKVQGAGECPAPAQVEQALEQLGATEGATPARIAEVTEVPEGLQLTLRTASGELLASREVQTRADCSQRARSVAVVLAAWDAELLADESTAAPLPLPPAWGFRFGAEATLGLTDHGGLRWLPSGNLVAQLVRGGARWGGLARLGVAWPTSSPVAGAQMVWMRPLAAVEAGPWMELVPLWGTLQAELLGGVSLLRVWGDGFAQDAGSNGLDLSVSPGLRWVGAGKQWRPSLAAGATLWLVPQRVRVAGSTESRTLPQWEARVSAGFSWGP